jgi:hypothetical protein
VKEALQFVGTKLVRFAGTLLIGASNEEQPVKSPELLHKNNN